MKYSVYNQKGEEASQTLLPKELFEIVLNSDLLHQVVVSQMANRRSVIAHTKDRGAVSGGGKKPWKQKGTGRARHGSNRSPIWKGGGVTFGPTNERVFKKKINTKMKRKALLMALSAKRKSNLMILLDELVLKEQKTRSMKQILDNLPCKEQSCLIALPSIDQKIILASKNLKQVDVVEARNLNALDLLSFKYVLFTKKSIAQIKKVFVEKSQTEN